MEGTEHRRIDLVTGIIGPPSRQWNQASSALLYRILCTLVSGGETSHERFSVHDEPWMGVALVVCWCSARAPEAAAVPCSAVDRSGPQLAQIPETQKGTRLELGPTSGDLDENGKRRRPCLLFLSLAHRGVPALAQTEA